MAHRVIRRPPTAGWARLEQWSLHVRFVIDEVAPGHIFLFVLRFSPVSIIPRMPETRLYLNTALTKMTNGRRLGTFKQNDIFLFSGNTGQTSNLMSPQV